MNLVKTTVAFAALLGSAAVFAETPDSPTPASQTTSSKAQSSTSTTTAVTMPEFRNLDTNGDGKVSKTEAELSSTVSGQFGTLDANQDGSLTTSEYAKGTRKEHSKSHSDTSDSSSKNY